MNRRPKVVSSLYMGDILSLPLPELWRLWWKFSGGRLSDNTAKNYRRTEDLSRSLGDFPRPQQIAGWLEDLTAAGLNIRTVELHRNELRSVYSYAQQIGVSATNPVAVTPWRTAPLPEPCAIADIALHWEALLAAMPDTRARAFLGVLRFTGIRIQEALAITREDLVPNAEGSWRLSVVKQRTRGNSMVVKAPKGTGTRGRRMIPIRDPLRGLLEPLLAEPPVILRFCDKGGVGWYEEEVPFLFPYRDPALERLRDFLRSAAPAFFGPGKSWHVFRHSLACELLRAGKSVAHISEVLGHENIATTHRYCARLLGGDIPADVFDGLD